MTSGGRVRAGRSGPRLCVAGLVLIVLLGGAAGCGGAGPLLVGQRTLLAQSQSPAADDVDEAASGQVTVAESGIDPTQVNLAFVTFVKQDLDNMWGRWYGQNNYGTSSVQLVAISPGYQYVDPCSGNTVVSDTVNAFYCSADDAIQLPMSTINDAMAGRFFAKFDDPRLTNAGVAGVIAHEYGHNVHVELQRMGIPMRSTLGDGTKWGELFADCLAGTWFFSAYFSGYLENNDMESIRYGLESLGDPPSGSRLPHGTPAERVDALNVGYNFGQPARCMRDYLGTPVVGL